MGTAVPIVLFSFLVFVNQSMFIVHLFHRPKLPVTTMRECVKAQESVSFEQRNLDAP